MTIYAHEDLQRILALHAKWLASDNTGVRADLRYANLRSANLRSANLTSADLRSADLTSADLTYANLTYADLRYANLTSADLTYANLRSANLTYADLRYANLRSAVLSDGVTWAEYLSEVVPALLTAGGLRLEQVATTEIWDCHSWDNCPISVAFRVTGVEQVPALHRWQAQRFVQLFDARLIPLPGLVAS